MEEFKSQVIDRRILKNMVINEFKNNPSILLDAINKEDGADLLPANAKRATVFFVQNNASSLLDKMQPQLELFANIITEKMIEVLPNAAKSGHLQALNKTLIPEFKMIKYSDFQYYLAIISGDNLILGDSGVILQAESGKFYNSLFDSGETVKKIYLPLSKRHLVIGAKKIQKNYEYQKDINSAIAECAREFFVSPVKLNNSVAKTLTNNIGKRAILINNEKVKQIVKDNIWRERI